MVGLFLGWSPWIQEEVKKTAIENLRKFMEHGNNKVKTKAV
jgi:hypothetical protein